MDRFIQALQAYQTTHNGKNPNGMNARKWASDNDLTIKPAKPRAWIPSKLGEILTRKTITEYGAWLANESQGEDQGDFKLGLTLDPAYTNNSYSTLTYDPVSKTVVLRMRVKDQDLDLHFNYQHAS